MKLRMKILSGFLILVVMLAVAGIFSIYELMSIRSSVQSLLDDNYESVVAARKMIEALERQDMELAGSIIMLLSFLTVIGTVISDILLVIVDPRIRYEKTE